MARRTSLVLTAATVLLLVWLLAGCATGRSGDDQQEAQHQDAGRSGDGQQEVQHQEGAEQTANLGDVSNGKIVFENYAGLDLDIFVMNADGSGVRNLTHTTTANEGGPVWSPNGQKIAFARGYQDASGSYVDTLVMNADGTGETRLTHGSRGFGAFAWSPDGKKIASLIAGLNDIYVINADGTGETKLTNTPEQFKVNVGAPLWSPDGKKIAFSREVYKPEQSGGSAASSAGSASARASNAPVAVENLTGIYVMNADGSDLHKLQYGISPAWSPDGKKIAFSSSETVGGNLDYSAVGANSDIYVMNSDGTGRTRLTNSPPSASNPAWSPDGKKIAYVGFEHPNAHTDVSSDIYVMNSDGTGQTRLTDTMAREYYPIWSPNGEKIAFESYVVPGARAPFICVINADGTDRRCPVKGAITSTEAWAKG